jgi:hypothetical protein
MTKIQLQLLSGASSSGARPGHSDAATGERHVRAFEHALRRMSHPRDEAGQATAEYDESEPVTEVCGGVPPLYAPGLMHQMVTTLDPPGAPLPARAIPVALDRMNDPLPSQAVSAGSNTTSWQFGIPSEATALVAMHLSTTAAGVWRMSVFGDAAGNVALRPHLETLRQRLQAAGKNLDELVLLEDE